MIRSMSTFLAASLAASGIAVAQTPAAPTGQPTANPRTAPMTSTMPTNQSAEEIMVKRKLSAAGVTDVKDLTRNPDGTWNGRGMKGNAEVAVMVDTEGNIKFQ